jgi:Tfp pilus assembly protein PilF
MLALCALAGLLLERVNARSAPLLLAAAFALTTVSISRANTWRTGHALWTEAERAAPGKVRPKIQLARVSSPPEAVALLERAEKIAPDDPSIASELGRVYLSSGAPDKALAEFGRALALVPNNPNALSNRGVALLFLKQNEVARHDFEAALQVDPCLFEARLNLARMGSPLRLDPACTYSDEERKALSESALQ